MPSKPNKSDAFPTKQLIIIGICRFSEPIAFNSILAYSYVMVQDLGIAEKDASFYSGLLISAYAVAEAITALGWGSISDVYGRKPVALIGLGGVALSSLLFGLAKHYWVALLARFVGGALNGNVAVMQTMVQEMVTNPAHEPKAYATQPFVWTLGGIIGSAMGGFLAQPAHFYPGVFSQNGLFGRYPYLLPNLVAVVAIVLAIIQGALFLEETNPHRKQVPVQEPDDVNERTPLRRAADRGSVVQDHFPRDRSLSIIDSVRSLRKKASFLEESLPMPIDQNFDIRRSSFGTMHSIKIPPHVIHHEPEPVPAPRQKTFNFTVVMLTTTLGLLAFHQMAFIATYPVYLLDEPRHTGLDLIGGLGFTLHDVGTFLAVNGFVALFIQSVIFPVFVGRVGVWKSFVSMILLYPTCYLIAPFLTALPSSLVSPGIYLSLVLQAFYGIILFPCALILLKNATPSPLVLGRVNGLAMSACCLARTVSSPLIGAVYGLGGSGAAWFSLVGAAIVAVVQLFWVPREQVDKVEVESGLKARRFSTITVDNIHEEAIED